jgi:single-strand DNA-binding protein
LAEVVDKYVRKGSQIYIEGRLRSREWERDGVKHYATEIVADDMKLLGRRPEGAQQGSSQQPAYQSVPQQPLYQSAPQQSAPQQPAFQSVAQPQSPFIPEEGVDDLPF